MDAATQAIVCDVCLNDAATAAELFTEDELERYALTLIPRR